MTGERQKKCRVYIVNDNTYEPDSEVFRLVLGNPESKAAGLAKVGRMNSTRIRINDDSDSKIYRYSGLCNFHQSHTVCRRL